MRQSRQRTNLVDTAALFWGLLFSSIGLGYFIYGKRQHASVPLVCGIALMVFPYFRFRHMDAGADRRGADGGAVLRSVVMA